MNYRALISLSIVAFFMSACQKDMVWMKQGSSFDDFNKEKYNCMQQSQQRASGAYVNAYGGAASDQMITNWDLYNSCMNSKGWQLTAKQESGQQNNGASNPLDTALKQTNIEYKDLCEHYEFKPLYLKTACKANDITLEQLADKSKVTELEKPLISKRLAELKSIQMKQAVANRTYGGAKGLKVALLLERVSKLNEDATLSIYDGSITWGDYNKRRKEIQSIFNIEFSEINQTQ